MVRNHGHQQLMKLRFSRGIQCLKTTSHGEHNRGCVSLLTVKHFGFSLSEWVFRKFHIYLFFTVGLGADSESFAHFLRPRGPGMLGLYPQECVKKKDP